MNRRIIFVFIIAIALAAGGCAHLEKGVKENEDKISGLEQGQEDLGGKVEGLQSEVSSLDEKVVGAEQSVYKTSDTVKALEVRLAEAEAKLAAMEKTKAASIKIKVLSGDGKLTTARETAKKLEDLGYSVKMVDRAPAKKYTSNMVYFKEPYRTEAVKMAINLGSNTNVKPLTWKSIFDIIVVTKSP